VCTLFFCSEKPILFGPINFAIGPAWCHAGPWRGIANQVHQTQKFFRGTEHFLLGHFTEGGNSALTVPIHPSIDGARTF